MRHCVYEFWNGRRPLYVGVTNNVKRRLKEHDAMGYAIADVTHLRLSFFLEREDAEAYESLRIGDLSPRSNIRGVERYLMSEERQAYWRDFRQEELDLAFGATELGPTPTYTPRERRIASLELLQANRVAA